MIRTDFGNIALTDNQKKNWVPFGVWTRPFSYVDGHVIGLSETDPTPSDILAMRDSLSNLPDTIPLDDLLQRFDPVLAIGREAQVFDAEALIRFMVPAYTINTLITYKNFWGGLKDDGVTPYPGLKQIGQGLVASGTITQADYDALNGILKEQGIDLNAR